MPDQPLTSEQVERMVKDANFVGPDHPYGPVIFNDLCCHVRALASELERTRAVLREMIEAARPTMPAKPAMLDDVRFSDALARAEKELDAMIPDWMLDAAREEIRRLEAIDESYAASEDELLKNDPDGHLATLRAQRVLNRDMRIDVY